MALTKDMIWLTKTALGLLKRVHPSKVEAMMQLVAILVTTATYIRLQPSTLLKIMKTRKYAVGLLTHEVTLMYVIV